MFPGKVWGMQTMEMKAWKGFIFFEFEQKYLFLPKVAKTQQSWMIKIIESLFLGEKNDPGFHLKVWSHWPLTAILVKNHEHWICLNLEISWMRQSIVFRWFSWNDDKIFQIKFRWRIDGKIVQLKIWWTFQARVYWILPRENNQLQKEPWIIFTFSKKSLCLEVDSVHISNADH